MTPVAVLPVGEFKKGQIYNLVEGRLVVYDQAHLSTGLASSGSLPETHLTSTPNVQ
jgi:hypothetical protein